VGAKDLFDTHDMPTGCGSPIYANRQPASDAAAVALIRRAGGLVLGKTVTTEFAFFSPGKTRNPHDPTRTPGGSSSGSAAAVADGMVPFALGTQTAGSIIRPASYCGVFGYKPTYGDVNTAGLKPGAWSLDTVGVFARNVPDVALLASVLSSHELELRSTDSMRPRIGLCRTPQWRSALPETVDALASAIKIITDAGCEVSEVTLPEQYDDLLEAQYAIMTFEASRGLSFERDAHGEHLSRRLRELLDEGSQVSHQKYIDAKHKAATCRAALDDVFSDVDVLLAPSAPGEAPAYTAGTGDPIFNRIWTLLGTPCLNVPGMTGPNDLPVGVQLIAPLHGDRLLLEVGQWLDRAFRAN
jgi:Asp-tRNA(Asn)/Glu-tRNA(Gln) amidotransferase A subunit family amidase